MLLRALNVLFAVLFFYAASLQFNDPDPVQWVLIYTAAAAVCVLAAMQRLAWTFAAAVALIAFGWAAVLAARSPLGLDGLRHVFDEFKMSKGDVAIEEAREAIGLGIVAGWSALLAIVFAVAARRRGARARRATAAGPR